MIILPIAGIVYGVMAFWFSRRVYRQIKIDAYKTSLGKMKWKRNQGTYAVGSMIAGYVWPLFIALGTIIWTGKGMIWIVTHGQEIPAETQDKIDALESELFPEEKNDAVVNSVRHESLCNCTKCLTSEYIRVNVRG